MQDIDNFSYDAAMEEGQLSGQLEVPDVDDDESFEFQ